MAENDNIVLKYDVDISKLDAQYEKLIEEMGGVDKAQQKLNKDTQKEAEKTTKAVGGVSKAVSTLGDKMKDLAGRLPFANEVKSVLEFQKGILGAGNATTKTAGAFKILRTAIIATGIGALVAGLVGLINYFKRTDDGATFFAGTMRGLGAAFQRLIEPITAFGKKLVEVFNGVRTFPELLSEIGASIQENLINRLKAFAVFGDSIVKLISGDLKGGFEGLADAGIQFATGVTEGTRKAREELERLQKEIAEGIDLETRIDANNDAFRDLSVTAAEANKQITQLFLQARNRGLEAEARQRKLVEALEIEEKISKDQIALQEERIRLGREEAIAEGLINDENLKNIEARKKLAQDGIGFEEALRDKRFEITDDIKDKLSQNNIDLIALEEARIKRTEKALNVIAGLNEEAINEYREKQDIAFKQEEVALNQSLLNREITQEQYAERQLQTIIDTSNGAIGVYRDSYQKQLEAIVEFQNKGLINEEQAQSQRLVTKQNFDKLILDEELKLQKAQLDLFNLRLKDEEDAKKAELEMFKVYDERILMNNAQSNEELLSIQLDAINKGVLTEKEANIQRIQNDIAFLDQRIDLYLTAGKDIEKLELERLKKENELKKAQYEKDVENKKNAEDAKKQLVAAGFDIAGDLANEFAQRSAENAKAEIQAKLDETTKATDKQIAENQRLLDAGVISQEQFNARKARLDEKQRKAEAEAKRKQFEADKEAKIIQAIIAGALAFAQSLAQQGVPAGLITGAIALAAAGAQVAVISSQPTPKFAKGGIIKGNSHAQGGVNIEAEGGEFIVNKRDTSKNMKALKAINSGMFDKFVKENYVLPELKKSALQGFEHTQNNKSTKLLESLVMNGMVDTTRLEKITKGNKSIKLENTDELASAISKKMNNSYIK